MYDERSKACCQVVDEILVGGAYKATKFLSDKLTVKATRKRYKGKPRKSDNVDIVLTIGKPNFEEREKIKRAKKDKQGPIEMTMKYSKLKK